MTWPWKAEQSGTLLPSYGTPGSAQEVQSAPSGSQVPGRQFSSFWANAAPASNKDLTEPEPCCLLSLLDSIEERNSVSTFIHVIQVINIFHRSKDSLFSVKATWKLYYAELTWMLWTTQNLPINIHLSCCLISIEMLTNSFTGISLGPSGLVVQLFNMPGPWCAFTHKIVTYKFMFQSQPQL